MNRETIKYIAMAAMFLNHFANVFLTPGTLLHEVLLDVGYFTAVTMCYFLVEGYQYTRSKRRYARRLLLFAVISQVPYYLAVRFLQFNMLFTLLLCFLILYVMEHERNQGMRRLLLFLLVCLSIFFDWAVLAPVFTILFALAGTDRRKIRNTYITAGVLFAAMNLPVYMEMYPAVTAMIHAAASSVGILVSGILILYCYNGKQSTKARTFSKWFFYIFYPAHLLILGLIRVWGGQGSVAFM